MEDTLVSYRVAKLTKDKGLSIATTYYYDFSESVGSSNGINKINWNKSLDSIYSAPTQSLLAKWLREKHLIHIWVEPVFKNYAIGNSVITGFIYFIGGALHGIEYDTFEEALDEGLYQALLLLK